MDRTIPINFEVSFDDEIKPLTPTLGLCRARIFYKGLNRNGSYITDEFAEKLIQTLPYAPVKGIYDGETADYGGHRYDSPRGQVYGVVPGADKLDFAWQEHLDVDGISRTYATCNVILYTAIFDEAKKIPEKGQSMELYPPSIQGEWSKDFNNQEAFVFTDGCFLGLQVLGDKVEPCFEGASFYSLEGLAEQFSTIVQEIQKFELNIQKGSEQKMPFKYNLSEDKLELFQEIWQHLNTNFTEENGYVVDYDIYSLEDQIAIVHGIAADVMFALTWEVGEDEVKNFNELQPVSYIKMTEDLQKLFEKNNNSFEGLFEKFESYENTISELNAQISDFNTEIENYKGQISEKDANYATLETEVERLKDYKYQIEKNQKECEIAKYSDKIDAEAIEQFTTNIDNYTIENLKKELAFTFVQNSNLFEKEDDNALEPKEEVLTGIAVILSKYENQNKN